MKKIRTFFTVLLPVLLLSACGQPGPLYLPGDEPPIYVPKKTDEEK